MTDVARFLLAPRWLAWHAATLVAVVGFGWLATWQLAAFRAEGRPSAPVAAPGEAAVPLAELARPGTALPTVALGRPVRVEGRYQARWQLLVPGRRLGEAVGFHVLTPLVTSDGAVVPVRRGWVADVDSPATQPPRGVVTVTGVLLPSEPPGAARVDPGRGLPDDRLPVVTTAELMRRLPVAPDRLYEGFVALTGQQPGATGASAPQLVPLEPLPAPGGGGLGGLGRWQNLGYTLQWWVFAAAAVVFWVMVVRNAVADRRAGSGRVDAGPGQTGERAEPPVAGEPERAAASALTERSATNDAKGTVPASSTNSARTSGHRS